MATMKSSPASADHADDVTDPVTSAVVLALLAVAAAVVGFGQGTDTTLQVVLSTVLVASHLLGRRATARQRRITALLALNVTLVLFLLSGRGVIDISTPSGGRALVVALAAFLGFGAAGPRGAARAVALAVTAIVIAGPVRGVPLPVTLGAAAIGLYTLGRLAHPPHRGVARSASSRTTTRHLATVAAVVVALGAFTALFLPDRPPEVSAGAIGDQLSYSAPFDFFTAGWGFDPRVPLTPADNPEVFEVDADGLTVWRVRTFTSWTGSLWLPSIHTDPGQPAADTAPTAGWDPLTVEHRELDQRVTIDRWWSSFAPAAPGALDVALDETILGVTPEADLIAASLGQGASYTLSSEQPIVTAEALALPRHDARLLDTLPSDVESQVIGLTEVTIAARNALASFDAGSSTTYDTVLAIQAWIADNITIDAEVSPSYDVDFVESMLLSRAASPEGATTLMALMARAQGIPARVVIGYLPGSRSLTSGNWVVHARDIHPWVEVWFPGIGWQPFSPTADLPLLGAGGSSWQSRTRAVLAASWPFVVGALALGAATFLAVQRWARRRGLVALPWLAATVDRLHDAGLRRGRPRHVGESFGAYVAALADGPLVGLDVGRVTPVIDRAAFAPSQPASAERSEVDRTIEAALDANPAPTLLRRLRAMVTGEPPDSRRLSPPPAPPPPPP